MDNLKDKRRYTEVLAGVEVALQYQNKHLENIDKKLEKQNSKLSKQDRRITRLEVVIAICLFGGGGITGALKLAGLF